jgi:hypothetical protein
MAINFTRITLRLLTHHQNEGNLMNHKFDELANRLAQLVHRLAARSRLMLPAGWAGSSAGLQDLVHLQRY